MSITASTRTRSTRAKIALVPLISIGLFGSLAIAAPAQAHDDGHDDWQGCSVKPLDPKDLRGNRVDFSIKVKCDNEKDGRKDGEKSVLIRQLRYEDEHGPQRSDDFLGFSYFYENFDRWDDARILHSVDRVRNLDHRSAEEVYHLVSFKVKDNKGHWSDWSGWKSSEVVEVRR